MIPEKVGLAQSTHGNLSGACEENRTQTLVFYENSKVVGRLSYDRLSSAVALVHELKILAAIKCTQITIADGSSDTPLVTSSSGLKRTAQQGMMLGGVDRDHLKKILRDQLERARLSVMPSTLLVMAVASSSTVLSNQEEILIQLTSLIGGLKSGEEQLFWYPLPTVIETKTVDGDRSKCILQTAFCLLMPSTGVLKAQRFVAQCKSRLAGLDWDGVPFTLYAGIGSAAPEYDADLVLSRADENLKQSVRCDGKVFDDGVTTGSQVTVEEKSQLFMIARRLAS